jgi:hypothetical protein
MAELKTKRTGQSVESFLNAIEDENKRQDSWTILETMKQATQAEARMWGDSIVGFGDYRYKYESGRENDWFLVGFSPRKQNLTLYFVGGCSQFGDLLPRLGKYKAGNACLYINKAADIDLSILQQLIRTAIERASVAG